jgi:hypothetical protein
MTMGSQLWAQIKGVGIVGVYSAVVTLIVGYMVSMVIPMRVSEDQERDGLDISSHGERAWDHGLSAAALNQNQRQRTKEFTVELLVEAATELAVFAPDRIGRDRLAARDSAATGVHPT